MAGRTTSPHRRHPLWLIGNWKMWPPTLHQAVRTTAQYRHLQWPSSRRLTIAVAPPMPYLTEVRKQLPAGWRLAAQDAGDPRREGEATALVSLSMLRSVGVRMMIVGHSEVRARGTTSSAINTQLRATLAAGCEVVLCVGEPTRQRSFQSFAFVRQQVLEAMEGVPATQLQRLRIAYEPVWAIGSRATASPSPEEVQEMALWVRKVLAELYGTEHALSVPVLYGGSVDPENAAAFVREGGVRGLLVGRASRKPRLFHRIAEALLAARSQRSAPSSPPTRE